MPQRRLHKKKERKHLKNFQSGQNNSSNNNDLWVSKTYERGQLFGLFFTILRCVLRKH